ncbi:MAG: GNAT family N-acetyltransferase [candidate division Zixibacteria bacterium]|nr:GNAT family N-acetyltransferase [candidate division Zixibacteria bacterium]MDD5425216.1 GNAT family N-acetyltransferase [candidate division Zixibacteria bacterium]
MVVVRKLRPEDDLTPVLELCREFFAEYQSHHKEFFDTDNLSYSDIIGRFQESVQSSSCATIIALIDNTIVGYSSITIREQPRFYKIKKVGVISALMIKKEYRRCGIATRILNEANLFFREHGIKYYTFYTAVTNQAAVRLYEKLGMAPLHLSFIGET